MITNQERIQALREAVAKTEYYKAVGRWFDKRKELSNEKLHPTKR